MTRNKNNKNYILRDIIMVIIISLVLGLMVWLIDGAIGAIIEFLLVSSYGSASVLGAHNREGDK